MSVKATHKRFASRLDRSTAFERINARLDEIAKRCREFDAAICGGDALRELETKEDES